MIGEKHLHALTHKGSADIHIYVDMYGAESHMFAYIAKLLSDQDAGVTPSQV